MPPCTAEEHCRTVFFQLVDVTVLGLRNALTQRRLASVPEAGVSFTSGALDITNLSTQLAMFHSQMMSVALST